MSETQGDLIPLTEFIELCIAGAFIDYDGHGYYADADGNESEKKVRPSDILNNNISQSYSHVAWYNR